MSVSVGEGAADDPFEILIVCTANICRSPLAERLLQVRLDEAADGPPRFVVRSAGIRGWAGAAMDAMAEAELQRLGGDPTGFRARDLTVLDCEAADLILTATAEHRSHVLQECPRALKRTFTLLEFSHLVEDVEPVRRAVGDPRQLVAAASLARGASTLDDYDVGDPYGGPPELHREVADRINSAVDAVARHLTSM